MIVINQQHIWISTKNWEPRWTFKKDKFLLLQMFQTLSFNSHSFIYDIDKQNYEKNIDNQEKKITRWKIIWLMKHPFIYEINSKTQPNCNQYR